MEVEDQIAKAVSTPFAWRRHGSRTLSKTLFYFNELGRYVNEKIRASCARRSEQLCSKPAESSMDLLSYKNVP
jgi:hypothetical protein